MPPTPTSTGPEPAVPRPEGFPFRVLLAAPDALTIPIFALGVEARRRPFEAEVVGDKEALSRLIGGNLLRTLATGRYGGEHRLVRTRFRLGRRTAVYASWLSFPEQVRAEAFLGDHPRFGLIAIEATTRAELVEREAVLQAGAAKGRYDLGPLEHRTWVNRAKEYVAASEDLRRLVGGLSAVRKLRESLAADLEGTSVG